MSPSREVLERALLVREQYDKYGPIWTSKHGTQLYPASYVLELVDFIIETLGESDNE